MPLYEYFCDENGLTIEATHSMDVRLKTWGELCYVSRYPLGETDPLAPVRKVIRKAPGISVPVSNSDLKNQGFTKLVKRDKGVYENVTAVNGEKRYMKSGEADSIPHLHKKISD
jgi:hypothetical protein